MAGAISQAGSQVHPHQGFPGITWDFVYRKSPICFWWENNDGFRLRFSQENQSIEYNVVPLDILDVNHCMCCVCNFIIWFTYIYKAPKSIFHSGHNIIVRMFESNTEVMTQSLLMCGEVIQMNLVIRGQNYNPHWIQTQMKSKNELVLQRIRFWTACFWKICYRIPLMSRPAL